MNAKNKDEHECMSAGFGVVGELPSREFTALGVAGWLAVVGAAVAQPAASNGTEPGLKTREEINLWTARVHICTSALLTKSM